MGGEVTFGERVRDMRIERNLSQDGLAGKMPPFTRGGRTTRRTSSWVSNIEAGKNEPSISDLVSLAGVLQADVKWLLTGADSGDTEFIARLRGVEAELDDRGRRAILTLTDQQLEETRALAAANEAARAAVLSPTDDQIVEAMIAAGLDPAAAEEVRQRAMRILAGHTPDLTVPIAQPRPVARRARSAQ